MSRILVSSAVAVGFLGCGLVAGEPPGSGSSPALGSSGLRAPDSGDSSVGVPSSAGFSGASGSTAGDARVASQDAGDTGPLPAGPYPTEAGTADAGASDADTDDADTDDANASDASASDAAADVGAPATVVDDATSDDSPVCTPTASQCLGSSVQTCGSNGHWADAVACPGNAPQCTGEGICSCQAGATQCSGDAVETCEPDGGWGNVWTCATGACTDGACSGSTTVAPSCAPGGPGMTDCGPGGSGTESCCTSLEVPGGTFDRIASDGEVVTTGLASTVSGFRLDKYLVTVGRFRQYVNYMTGIAGAPPANGSGKHTHLNGGRGLVNASASPLTYETGWDSTDWDASLAPDGISWNSIVSDSWPTTAGSPEDLPVVWVNWYEAYAFCIWDGGFLPTATEWAYAAQGGSQEREYPWGSTGPDMDAGSTEPAAWNPQVAIVDCDYPAVSACVAAASAVCAPNSCGNFNLGCGQQIECDQGCSDTSGWSQGSCSVAAVGTASLGAGYWGQLDLVGEVSQWTLDIWPELQCPGDDCAFLGVSPVLPLTDNRAVRGCDYFTSCFPLTPQGAPADNFDSYKGFRCARTP